MGKPKPGEMWIYEVDGGQEAVIVHDVSGRYAYVSIPGSNDEDEIHEVDVRKLTLQQ